MARKRKPLKAYQNITITGLASKGKGVGRTEEGEVIFVEDVAPGDIVDVQVIKKRKKFKHARPTHWHKYSDDRQEPICEHFGVCGGCKLQHIPYPKQLEYKQEEVDNALLRIGKIAVKEMLPILPAPSSEYYRNKMEFSFSNKRWLTPDELNTGISNEEDVLGFHRPGAFDKIVDLKHCYLQPNPSNELRIAVKEIAIEQGLPFFDLRANTGMMRHVLQRISSTGEVMLIVVFYENEPNQIKILLDEVIRRFPTLTSVYYCVNSKANDFIMDLPFVHYHGKEWIEDILRDVRFRIGPKSFFQTNTKQAERLFNVVEKFAELNGEQNVYDLYTGIGSIALYIAHKCKQVVGIEEIAPAIEDAQLNMQLNNIENAVFYAGDVKHILTTEFAEKHGKPDLLITDPPRAGMHADVVKMLLQLESPKIVYVSCNPATQARDLNLLNEKYEVIKSQAVDMFPHTPHIENVVLLALR